MSSLSIDVARLSSQQRSALESWLNKHRPGLKSHIKRQSTDSNTFPLSFGQQRLWVMDQLEGGGSLYSVFGALRLRGRLSLAALEETLGEIVRRHEILRTTFALKGEQPVQTIAPARPVVLSPIELDGVAEPERGSEARQLLTKEAEKPFDLVNGPLFRTLLLRLGLEDHVLMILMHHAVCDGWSLGIFVRELRVLYEAYRAGGRTPLPELALQYADFAVWQREWLEGKRLEEQLTYWRRQLSGCPDVLELPTDRPRQALHTSNGASQSFVLPEPISEALKSLGHHDGATLFMTLLAAFNVLLYRYSGQVDVCVGTPVANRTRSEIEGLIGFFVNTLVIRSDLSGDPGFGDFVRRTRNAALQAFAHQDIPFEKLIEELRPQRNLGYAPLFQVDFALHNHSIEALSLPGLSISTLGIENGRSKFDLGLAMMETPEGLVGSLRYRTHLFDSATIARMAGHFQKLLESVAVDPDCPLSRIPILPDRERHALLFDWNDTATEFRVAHATRTMHHLLESQTARTPDSIAVLFGDSRISFQDLDHRANKLARYLQRLGVGPEVRVGLCIERSPEMVIGLIGIMKAGGAYVPLDPGYPGERMAYMLEDSGAAVFLTQSGISARLPRSLPLEVVCLDLQWELIECEAHEPPDLQSTSDNLAYIYYTSGSTGRPKGVAVAHYGIANYILWGVEAYRARYGNGAPVHSTIAADLTLANFLALYAGKPITLAREAPGIDGLVELIRENPDWGLMKITPTHLALLNPLIETWDLAGITRVLVIGADNLVADPTLVWRDRAPSVILLNEYGPTETVVGCSLYHLGEDTPREGPISIGKPIFNITMYVLDDDMQPVPAGVSGELYIGGIGVARGYWARAELTADKFVPDPFSGEPGSRLYKTGDRARFLRDGNMEFQGRLDYQVKIRGFRVELQEIEAVLSGHPIVSKVMVVLREDTPNEKQLVAYAAVPQGAATASELRLYLKERLPDYMVPSAFVLMERLPLVSNGKVDRRALPPPASVRQEFEDSFVPPKDLVELQLVQLWEELLDVRPIGVADSFFDLGGHSILAVRLMAKIQKHLGRQITLSVFFQDPTIRHLARVLRDQGATQAFTHLVGIQPRGAMRPFFCVHSLGGDVLAYYSLARHLGPERPFYGLQAPQPSETDRYVSIEDMAARYVDALREVQADGPYHIGGWSFGSVVAFEMAQQLTRQGRNVALLALLDGMSPCVTQRARERSDTVFLAALARDLARRSRVELELPHEVIKSLPESDGFIYILDKLKQARLIDQEISIEWIRSFLKGNKSRIAALKNYKPEVYDGPITLFRSQEWETESAKAWLEAGIDVTDKMRGWDKLSTRPVELHWVPGYHATLVFEPQARILAEQLRRCLEKAEQGH